MAVGILEKLRERNRSFPNHIGEKKRPPLCSSNRLRLTKLRFRFPDKYGRDFSLQWGEGVDLATGQAYPILCNLRYWPDPLYLEMAIDGHIAVETDVNFVRVSGWDRQPEELKQLVVNRLENPDLRPNVPPSLELDDEETDTQPAVNDHQQERVDQVEIDNGPMHPALPAMTQIIAAVARQAKQDGLVACGYVLADPSIFVDQHDHYSQNS